MPPTPLGAEPVEKGKAASKPPLKVGPPSARRVEFWKNYFAKGKDTARDALETAMLLRASGDMTDVEAVLGGFLYSRSQDVDPVMFGTLAAAIELNKGDDGRLKAWMDYFADLAEASDNPNIVVAVADARLTRGFYERVGPMLDRATAMVPHRRDPILMRMILARKTEDPDGMARAVEALLELSWPGMDDGLRAEARDQVDDLAKSLRSKGREAEAKDLLDRLKVAQSRDLVIRLTWNGDADLDLLVEEPLGAVASKASPRTVYGGSLIRDGRGKGAVEVYSCPRGFDGEYVVRVDALYNDPDQPVERATVEAVFHEGTDRERTQTWKIDLEREEPVVLRLEGGRRREILKYTATPVRKKRLRPGPLVRPKAPALLPRPLID